MSLHTLAQQLQSAGRGDDKILVHMTPAEVGGLQSLAKAHGGSLTINPETGLPEAGFLKSLLPMAIGFGLAPFTGGLSAALLTGAGYTAATGSLKQGLLAGLGAYGGAGLSAGLTSMGTAAAPNVVPPSAGVEGMKAAMPLPGGGTGAPVFANPTLPTVPTTAAQTATAVQPGFSDMIVKPMGTEGAVASTERILTPGTIDVRGNMLPGSSNFSAFDPRTTITPTTQLNTSSMTSAIDPTVVPRPEVIPQTTAEKLTSGLRRVTSGGLQGIKDLYAASNAAAPYSGLASIGTIGMGMMQRPDLGVKEDKSLIRPYDFEYNPTGVAAEPYMGSAERLHFAPVFTARTPYSAPGPEYMAAGGMTGPVEQMSQANAIGANTGYPMADISAPKYSYDATMPIGSNVVGGYDANVDAYTGEQRLRSGGVAEPKNSGYEYSYDPKNMQFTQTRAPTTTNQGPFNLISRAITQGLNRPTAPSNGAVSGGVTTPAMQPTAPQQPLFTPVDIPAYQTPEQQLGLGGFYDYMNQQLDAYTGEPRFAAGGISHLGDYSDGGRLLKGPGDGVSDSIPAVIGGSQPARLADGEFVIPARIVSELGNGSTEAGARKLYAMMDRVQKARKKTVGKNAVATDTKSHKHLPA